MKITILTVILFSFNLLSLQGQDLDWAQSVGSDMEDVGYSVVVDKLGNVYSTGEFRSTVDFDPGTNSYDLTSAGGSDVYVTKFNSDGEFIWARRIGNMEDDRGKSITLDSDGNVYIVGYFSQAVDFDPGSGTSILTSYGGKDIFICKLNADGNFIWAKQIGGQDTELCRGSYSDISNNIYIAGYFFQTIDFDPGTSVYELTAHGSDADAFVGKLDENGDLIWAKGLGGTSNDRARSITADEFGNVYVTGRFEGTADFDPGAGNMNLVSLGLEDVFVVKLDFDGNLVWARQIGGPQTDWGRSITVDEWGNVYTTGEFQGTVDFDPGSYVSSLTSYGGDDIFISKLDANGNFVWARQLGGAYDDRGRSIVTDELGYVYTTGLFTETADFNPGASSFNLSSLGGDDIFISKLDNDGNFKWALQLGGYYDDIAYSITMDTLRNLFLTGQFESTADFDPGTGMYILNAQGSEDIFITKLAHSTIGIDEDNTILSLNVFPNPTSGQIKVQLDNVNKFIDATVFDITGRQILNKQYYNLTTFSIEINENPGIYFIQLRNTEGIIQTFKIIKQ